MRLYIFDRQNNTFTGLSPNTEYTVAVIAEGDEFTHRNSNPAIATLTTEQLPQLATPQTTVDRTTGGRIEFSWDAIVTTNGVSVSYRVSIVRAGDSVELDSTTISATSHTFTGLEPDIAYRIEVVATAFSNRDSEAGVLEVETGTKKLPTPTALEIGYHVPSSSEITVSWSIDAIEGIGSLPGVTIFEIELVREDGVGDTAEEDVDATQPGSTTFTDLAAGTTYTLSVVSSGDSTKYRRSDAYVVMIRTDAEGQLERPVLTLTTEEDADIVAIVVSWTTITDAGNYEVNLYEVNTPSVAIETTITESAVTEVRFEDVLPGVTYNVGVIARSDTQTDSEEGVASIAIDEVTLSSPTATHISALSATTDSVTVTFTGTIPSTKVTVYQLELDPDPQNEGEVDVSVDEDGYTFAGLMPDTEYAVNVVSSRDGGGANYDISAAYTQRITTDQLPQLETSTVTATATTNSITATWDEVAYVVNYEVSLYEGGDTSGNQVDTTQTIDVDDERTASFTNLTPGTQYTVAVVAIAADPVTHRNSDPGTATVTTDRQRLPTPTADQISFTATTQSITMSWINVPSEVSTYSITIKDRVDMTLVRQESVTVHDATSRVFGNLSPTTWYEIEIIAQGNPAQYIDSDTYEVFVPTRIRTPEFDVTATTDTVTVSNIEVDDRLNTVFFIAPVDNIILDITIWLGDQVQSTATRVGTSFDGSLIPLTGLEPGTTYTVSLVVTALDINAEVVADSDTATTQVTTLGQQQLATPTILSVVSIDDNVALGDPQEPQGALTITWAPGDNNAELYVLSVYVGNTEYARTERQGETSIGTTVLSHTFNDLRFATLYTVNLVARAADYEDSAAATTEAWTSMFRVLPNANRVVVQWTDADGTDASVESKLAISGGNQEFRFSIDGIIPHADVSTRGREHRSAPVLSPGTDYVLRVAILNDNEEPEDYDLRAHHREQDDDTMLLYEEASRSFNNSPFSTLRFRTRNTPLPLLATPQNVQVTAAATSITATWDAVVNAIRYEVSLYEGDSISSTRVGTAQMIDVADERTASFTDLSPDTQYTVAVIALGDPATYSDSEPGTATITTETGLPQLATPTILSVVSIDDNVAKENASGELIITWASVADASSYVVSVYVGNTEEARTHKFGETTAETTELSLMLDELRFAALYTVSVVARAEDYDDSAAATTEAWTGMFRVVPSENNVTVQWSLVHLTGDDGDSLYLRFNDTSLDNFRFSIDSIISPVDVGTDEREYMSDPVLSPGTDYVLRVALVPEGPEEAQEAQEARDYTLVASSLSLGLAEEDVVLYRDESRSFNNSPFSALRFRTLGSALPQLTSPTVTATATADSITATWEAVADAVEYEVSLYTGSSVIPANQVGATQTTTGLSLMFTGLSAGTEYTVAVVAIANPATHSDSEAGTVQVTPQLPQLATPSNVRVTDLGSRTVTINWDDAGTNVVRYEVTIYLGNSVYLEDSVDASLRSQTFGGVEPGTTYSASVVAIANPDTHRDSEPGTVTFTTPQLPQLATPPILSATATTDSITATWSIVANATNYAVSLYEGSGIVPANLVDQIDAMVASHTFTGLSPNTEYTVAVIAEGEEFTHRNSNPAVATLTTEQLQLATPQPTADLITGGRVEFSWVGIDASDSTSVSYSVRIERVSDGIEIDSTTISATSTTSHTFTGLDPVTEYRIEVVAMALNHRDSAAGATTVTTLTQKLPMPTTQIGHTANMDSITVTWTDTPPATGVTVYEMTLARADGTGDTAEEYVDATQPGSTTFPGLAASTTYILSVVSSGDSTKYRRSDAYVVRIKTDAEGQLTRPVLTLTMEEDADVVAIVASWITIASATTYQVNLYNVDEPSVAIATQPVEAAATEARFEDVLPDVTYNVGVIARSDTQPDSEEGVASIEIPNQTLTSPTATHIAALTATASSVTVTFTGTKPSIKVTIYELELTPGPQSTASTEVAVSVNEDGYTFAGLTPDTEYEVSVVSSRDTDQEHYQKSEAYTQSITTKALPQLDRPRIEEPAPNPTNVIVSWEEVTNATSYEASLYEGIGTSGNQVGATQTIDAGTGSNPSFASASYENLTPGTQYTVAVVAIGNPATHRDSDASTSTFTTLLQSLRTPTTAQITLSATTNSITVSWINVPAEVTTYDVQLGGARIARHESVAVLDGSIVFGDLIPAAEYLVGVTARGNPAQYINSGAYMESIATRILRPEFDVAATTDTVTVSNIDIGDVSDLMNNPGEEVRLDSTIYLGNQAQSTTTVGVLDDSSVTFTFTGLAPDTTYTVSVVAVATQDEEVTTDSDPSTRTITTETDQLATPQPTAGFITGDSIEFSWNAIVATDGASVSYGVRIERVSDGVEIDSTTISATSHTFTGLDPETAYTIEVVATAPNYRDSAAGVLAVTTTAPRLQTPDISVQANNDNIHLSSVIVGSDGFGRPVRTQTAHGELIVSWNLIANADRYAVSIYIGNTDVAASERREIMNFTTMQPSHTIRNLRVATLYTISVTAQTDNSDYANSAQASTEAWTGMFNVQANTQSLTVRWTEAILSYEQDTRRQQQQQQALYNRFAEPYDMENFRLSVFDLDNNVMIIEPTDISTNGQGGSA